MVDDFKRASDAFLEWFLRQPNASMSSKIILADLRVERAGRGIVAVADIEADEELFVIPRDSLLCLENCRLNRDAPELFSDLDSWLSLILVMIFEFLQGSNSRWQAYFAILPQKFDTLIFWSPDELSALQGSAVLEKIGKAAADDAFRAQIVPRIMSRPELFPKRLSELQIVELSHRMASIIMSYAFDVEGVTTQQAMLGDQRSSGSEEDDSLTEDDEDDEDKHIKALVPLADLLNADASANNARLVHEDSTFTMKSLKPIRRGQQIYNDYGPLPRSDLLRRYGYLTENYAQFDVVEISRSLIVEQVYLSTQQAPDDDLDVKLDLLDREDVLEDSYDLCHPDPQSSAFPKELLLLVNTLLLTEKPAAIKARDSLPKADFSPKTVGALRCMIKARQASYPTTLEEDERLLGRLNNCRVEMAVTVRMGEKKILLEALNELNAIGSMKSGLERDSKRRRLV